MGRMDLNFLTHSVVHCIYAARWLSGKESACSAGAAEMWVRSLGQEDPLEKEMITHLCSCLENFHGQRSLAGYSRWVAKSRTRLSN